MSSRWRERLGRTLGFRLALWYAVVYVASSLALVGLTYALLAWSLRQYDREIVETTLVQYAGAYTRGGVDGLVREIQRSQTGTRGPLFVRIVGARQQVVFVSMPEAWERFDLGQLAAPPLQGQQTWATLRTGEPGETLEVASVRLRDATLFQVGMSTERREELLARFRRVLLLVSASILLVGLAGGITLTASALQPVRALAAAVRQIMRTGRTDARVQVGDRHDALGELSVLFNAMLDRIDAVLAGMRGALDNVAHDLRTPMTRLRGIAEAGLRSDDPAALRDALADCVEESDRVVAMLGTLMDISEAETGAMRLEREAVDLAEIVAQALDLYEDAAEHRGVTLTADAPPGAWVLADRSRLRQVIANLLDNAIKYTPGGGRVHVGVAREAEAAVVHVSDTGAGIAPDEQPHIWERLYRGDKSRSERGLGLGLSLVKAIVEAHGGQVGLSSEPGQGARFDIRLPLAPDMSPM